MTRAAIVAAWIACSIVPRGEPASSFAFTPMPFGARTHAHASARVQPDPPERSELGVTIAVAGIVLVALGAAVAAKRRYASSSATAPGQSATGCASRPSARSGLPPPRPPSLAASCFHSAAQSSAEPAARTSNTVPTSGA